MEHFLLDLIMMNLQQSVDDHIVTYLTSQLKEAKMFLESDREHLVGLQNGLDQSEVDQSEVETYEEMVQDDRDSIAEYELALESPNTWILSQPNLCYILKHWAHNCSLLLNTDSHKYKMFQGHMRSFTMLVIHIAGLWEPLANKQYKFLDFVDSRLDKYLPGMYDEITVTRSVMGAVYTMIGQMWQDFHNQPGEPFLQSREMVLDTLTRAVMSSLYVSHSEGVV